MDKLFNVLTYVIGFLFLLMGLQWLVDPTSAAAGLGMSLLSGHGLSTQIGDLASFFLVVGVFTLCAALKRIKFGYILQLPYLASQLFQESLHFYFTMRLYQPTKS